MTNPKHTDTSRSGDLVKRLRNLICHGNLSCDTLGDCEEIADHIEALQAEVERLRQQLSTIGPHMKVDPSAIYPQSGGASARAALGEKQ